MSHAWFERLSAAKAFNRKVRKDCRKVRKEKRKRIRIRAVLLSVLCGFS
jgi:hypothetical protein